MEKGTKYWNIKKDNNGDYHYFIQTNNPTEQILERKGVKEFLESCGPSAAVNCCASIGAPVTIYTPGEYRPQPEEVLMDFFHNPANQAALLSIRNVDWKIHLPNRIPQYYPYAVKKVFGVNANYFENHSFNTIASKVVDGNAIQACLVKPGHYIAIVAYDDIQKELIYNDSWPNRFADGNGFNRRMNEAEFQSNVCNYFVEYFKLE